MEIAGKKYRAFCERLWRDWLGGTLQASEFLRQTFDLKAAPEPYIRLKAAKRELVALLTNPGSVMPHQRRRAILRGNSPLSPSAKYATCAKALGKFYLKKVKKAARRRNRALLDLAKLSGYGGVLYVECCPFHSARFPKKRKFVEAIEQDHLLGEYVERLRDYLHDKPVIAVSATATEQSLTRKVRFSPWLEWQAALIGVRQDQSRFIPLIRTAGKTTAAAFVDKVGGTPKVLVLMMGGNHLPAATGIAALALAMRVN